MLNKKISLLRVTVFSIILIIFFITVNGLRKAEFESKNTLKSVVGNSLFKIQDNFKLIQASQMELTLEVIEQFNEKLLVIKAYADTVDLALSPNRLLNPIVKNMLAILRSIETSYTINLKFTEDDNIKYQALLEHIKTLLPLITKVYYDPASIEGAETTLKINNKDSLILYNDELSQYVSELD